MQLLSYTPLSFIVLLSVTSFEARASTFREDVMIAQLMESGIAPLQHQIDALQAEESHDSIRRIYAPLMEAQTHFLSSKKDAANSFQPSLEKSYGYSMNVSKAWNFGARTKVGFEESYSRLAFSPDDIRSHEPFLFAELQVNLFQNLLGRIDRASLEQASLGRRVLTLQKDLALHQSIVQARSLYWSLVANHISSEISKGLLKASQQQLENIRKREKTGVAERSDVLLSQAQVSQRESALLGLQIRQQGIARSIQMLIPNFKTPQDEEYPPFSVTSILEDINSCIGFIQSSGEITPLQYSSYSDLLPLIDQISTAEQKTSTQGFGPDLNLLLRGESTGVDTAAGKAFEESVGFSKNRWSAGLQLSIPLDATDSRLKNIKKKKAELSRFKQSVEIKALLDSTHRSASQSIAHLLKTVGHLQTTTGFLKDRVRLVEKKYQNGRVDFLNLVQEQDQLFNAENGLIETQLVFMEELLRYFSAFDKLPCKFSQAYAQATEKNGAR